MKPHEIRMKTLEDVKNNLLAAEENFRTVRFQLVTAQLENSSLLKKAKQEVDETIAKARLCLHSTFFKEYVSQYAKSEKSVIEKIFVIDTREADPLRYAFRMKEAIGELRHIKALMNSVRLKAKVIK